MVMSVCLGYLLGALSGYIGGLTDKLIMRVADLVMTIPGLPLLIVAGAMLSELDFSPDSRIYMVVVMLSLLEWPRLARLVRGQCLSLRERDFMLATQVLGLSARRRLFGHLLPNTIPILVVMATMAVANAILSESALSYLGLGVVPPTPSWGNMMDAANSLIDFQRRPWLWMPPGIAIFITVIAINVLGDGLRDAMDPNMKPRMKCVTAMALMGLLPPQTARIDGGEIRFADRDLLRLKARQMADLRGHQLAMIFQEPMSALNPVLTIGEQLCEPPIRHLGATPKAAWHQAIQLLSEVGLARGDSLMTCYPHQLSGGMLQRVMIAMALSCRPKLLIADEPTTALDVTVQAQILRLLRDRARASQMAMMLITHDLGVIAQMAEQVVVMYAGRIVEQGATAEVLRHPQHPYTRGLIASRPVPGERRRRLYSIPGQVPDLAALPAGCAFAGRCERATARCREAIPPLLGDRQRAACFYSEFAEVTA